MKQKITKKGCKKESRGITLVALVVTIVVLLVLAGITITMLFGDNGIIKQAQKAKDLTQQDEANTQQGLQNLVNELNNVVNNYGIAGGSDTELDENKVYKITDKQISSIVDKTIKVTDSTGKNIITLPKGFRIKTSEGTSVQQGIVITDSENDETQGNEFVWIPVGVVTKDDGSKSNEIKLGRYTFSTSSPGNPTLATGTYQYAYTDENPTNYTGSVANLKDYYKKVCHELVTRADPTQNDGVASNGMNGLNAIAKNLGEFVTSVKNNGGYYLARYEASYGSGYDKDGRDDIAKYGNAKPLSQPSVGKSTSSMSYTKGTLWNFITELNASKVCRNMYADNVGVESDLVNSYAWDTAIVYIQEMGNTNYANKNDENGTLRDTGVINASPSNPNDEVCKINDMGSNLAEFTTEYTTYTQNQLAIPCVARGGDYYYSNISTASRIAGSAPNIYGHIGFRSLLYVRVS